MNLIQALKILGDWEVTSINSVADMTLLVGFKAEHAAFLVTVDGKDGFYFRSCPVGAAHAVLTLFLRGDEVPDADVLYTLAEPWMPTEEDEKPFRCIP